MSKATVKTSWLSLSLQAFSLQHLLECFCFIVLLGCSDWMAFWQDQHRLFYKWLYLWPTMQECTRWPNMQIFRNIFAILRVTEFAGLSLVMCNLIQFCDPCSRMNIFAQFKRAIQRDGKQKWRICHKAWSFFSAAIAGHHLTVPWGTTCQTFHRWLKFPAATSISRITRIQVAIDRKASAVFQTLKKLHPNTVVCDFQYFNSMSACRLASEGIAYVETVRHRSLWNLFDTLRNFVGLYPSSNIWVCLELAYRQMAIYL